MTFTLEIATTDFNTTHAAVNGGADRIELCASLTEGGVTPSFGMIKKCREAFELPIFPIIRPRGGDFLYTDEEYQIMFDDIRRCRELGCDGIVTGLLNAEGNIDWHRLERIVSIAYPMEVTFHRAFDRCREPFEAMEELIRAGCQRILTSGQQLTAPEGIELIGQLIKAADGRIIIMPGSGIRKENIKEIADKSGAVEFHSSLRGKTKSAMQFIHPSFAGSEESFQNPFIDQQEVMNLRKALTE